MSADAATDSKPPGIGGFCHGLYWYIPIAVEWLAYLHITVLELLATGLGAITLAPYLMHAQRVRLQSDALATPFVLSRHRAHSPTLMIAHHALLQDDQYLAVAANAEVPSERRRASKRTVVQPASPRLALAPPTVSINSPNC